MVIAQKHEIQIGVQGGLAIPMGQFASGYGPYVDNGYASKGYNYKVYAEYRVKGVCFLGVSYINFSNSQDEGNVKNGFNNRFSTNNVKIDKESNTQGVLGSIILKGTETPLFIKGFLGLGYSTSGAISANNSFESTSTTPSTSDIGGISGIGIGFNIPIKNKWFLELEADYISSAAKPKNIIYKDNNSSYYENWGDINYNQTVINLNIGVGIFLFRE
jgi:hypothetical protein